MIMEEQVKPNKEEITIMLEEMISNIDNLPPGAALAPITHLDYQALLLILKAILLV